jgi:threonine/homoserine/homoserine lactone efflux protein
MLAFLLGWVLGFVGSVPAAGPLAVSVVAATLDDEPRRALRLSVGGAAAECGWASLAFFSVDRAALELGSLAIGLRALGAAVLIVLGFAMLRGAPTGGQTAKRLPARGSELATGFAIVATNPAFFVVWAGFSSFVFATPGLPRSPVPLIVAGAFAGIVAWFWTLGKVASRVGRRLAPAHLARIRALLSVTIIGFGIWLAASAVHGLATLHS